MTRACFDARIARAHQVMFGHRAGGLAALHDVRLILTAP
jgi:hypothetical protein